jgi:hypothetical protein
MTEAVARPARIAITVRWRSLRFAVLVWRARPRWYFYRREKEAHDARVERWRLPRRSPF